MVEVETSNRCGIAATMKHMYASSWRLCVGATSNMVRLQQKLLAQAEKDKAQVDHVKRSLDIHIGN